MELCTQAHFNFNDDLSTIDQRIPIGDGLCPPVGLTVQI